MESPHTLKLARLWSAWLHCAAIAAAERQRLIEMAGDRLCTGCGGPTQVEVERMEELERAHRLAGENFWSAMLADHQGSLELP